MQILSRDQIAIAIFKVEKSAVLAKKSIEGLSPGHSPLNFIQAIKFQNIGFDPLDENKRWNLIEQVNQTFTYLVSFRAADILFTLHPEAVEIHCNLGTEAGYDIVGKDEKGNDIFTAEVFAATSIHSNQKLRRDVKKVLTATARYKYVFFLAGDVSDVGWYTKYKPRFDLLDVKIYSFGSNSIMSGNPTDSYDTQSLNHLDSYDTQSLDHLKSYLLTLAKRYYPSVDTTNLIQVSQGKAIYRSATKDARGKNKFICEITVVKNELSSVEMGFLLTYMSEICFQIQALVSTAGGVIKLLDSYEHWEVNAIPRPCGRKPIYELIYQSDLI